ncbi:MAG: PAS domain-containing protein, partial [Fluviibacter sp.]
MHSPALNIDSNLAREIFLNAPLGIARVSLEGRFLEVNPKLCSMLGYTRDEFLNLSVFDITDASGLEVSYERLKKITSGVVSGFDLSKRYVRKDGTLFWVRVTVSTVYDLHGRMDYFVSSFEDISEKIAFENELIKSESKYRTIINTTLQGFWIVDFDLNILEVNEAYCRMTGYSRHELLGLKVEDLEADEDAEDIANRQQAIAKEGKASFVTHHRRKN